MQYKVKNRQSLLDVAMLTCGSAQAVFALAERNGLSVTADLEAGVVITYDQFDVVDRNTVIALETYGADPATGVTAYEVLRVPFGGIGYMGIEIDFIIS